MAEPLPSHLVELFDPASPAVPRRELAANFDPHRHVRWEHRPAVAELDLSAAAIGNKALPRATVAKLEAAGLVNLKAILAAGHDGLKAAGLSRQDAEEVLGWATTRAAAVYALAELEAEGGQAAVEGAEPAVPEGLVFQTAAPEEPGEPG